MNNTETGLLALTSNHVIICDIVASPQALSIEINFEDWENQKLRNKYKKESK